MINRENPHLSTRGRFCRRFVENGGFTLIEVVIGIVIFTVVLLALFQMFAFSAMQNRKTAALGELGSIAERSIETIKDELALTGDGQYRELTSYTLDADTKARFFVAYRVTRIEIEEPEDDDGLYGSLPTKAYNYNIEVEVCARADSARLGALGTVSRQDQARELGVLLVRLVSQAIRYESG